MTDQQHRDDLTQLRAELAAQRAVTSAQQARLARLERRRRFPRRFLPLALMGLLVALLPLSILAAGPFGDLNSGHDAANADIQAIADAGITKGCNPPDFTAYCPNDLVTREQMASFLARTAGLGGNPPVANAAQLGGISAAGYVRTDSAAALANLTVNGHIRKAYTPGTASNAAPVAFGTVDQNGTVLSGTPNVQATKQSAGTYVITIFAESYDFTAYTTVATLLGSNPGFVITGSAQNKLIVSTRDSAGTLADRGFQFVVFQP